jgi:GNAT superfamily N-acetyltransferase
MYRIEKAVESQISEIAQIWLLLMKIHEKLDKDYFSHCNENVDMYERDLFSYFRNDQKILIVLLHHEKIVGYVTAEITSRFHSYFNNHQYCIIGDIMIKEDHQKKSLGKEMVNNIAEWAKTYGVNRIELNVFGKNKAGYDFFKRIGFQDSMHTLSLEV